MKKRTLGDKTPDRRRPLDPSQFRRRFLAHQYDDPEVTKRGGSLDYLVEVDDCWDCYDPGHDCLWLHGGKEADKDDLYWYELDQFLIGMANSPPPLIRPEWGGDATPDGKVENTVDAVAHNRIRDTAIEERLAEYVARLRGFPNDSVALRSRIMESIGDFKDREVVRG